jgi:hypothetical protein
LVWDVWGDAMVEASIGTWNRFEVSACCVSISEAASVGCMSMELVCSLSGESLMQSVLRVDWIPAGSVRVSYPFEWKAILREEL